MILLKAVREGNQGRALRSFDELGEMAGAACRALHINGWHGRDMEVGWLVPRNISCRV